MSKRGLSLRWRMVLLVAGIPLLILSPLFLHVVGQYRLQYRQVYWEKADLLTSELEQIIETVGPYIETVEDAPGLTSLLRRMADTVEEISFIALVDARGLVIEYSAPGIKGTVVPQLANLDDAERPVRDIPPYGRVYLISRSIPMPGDEDQTLYMVVGERAALVDPPMTIVTVMGIGGALGMVVLIYFSMNLVLRPLERLAEGAAIIGAGDLSYTIPVQRKDEIGFVARAFNDMAHQLRDIVSGLERKVTERTKALERKTRQLEAVSLVSKQAAQVHNVSALLDIAVEAVRDNFGFYHTGIFILDDEKEWAILRAASSEGGQRMLSRGHRLQVGQMGIVGYAAATGRPRIAFNVGEDAVWFNNPDLPLTHSEMALPLKIEGDVIGVLDVQSDVAGAFSDEDIRTLQLMADQLAVALNNARSLEVMESMLAEVRELQTDYSRQGWARVAARMPSLAYEYDRVGVSPVPPLPVPADLQEGRMSHKVIMDGGTPVVMESISPGGGRVLGYLGLADSQRIWTEDELALVESVSEQIALALENARLFENTQLNQRQQFLISSVLQTASNPDLETDEVLLEIGRILAQGLDMAVGIFTYPVPDVALVHPNGMVAPEGHVLPLPRENFLLSREHHIFFQGLTRPELGPAAPLLGAGDGDTSAWLEALSSEERQMLAPYDVGRVLYVPVSSGGVHTGFIAMMQREGDAPLDPDTRDLAQNLASQIAVVIDNLNLSEETRKRSAELSELYQISLAFSELLEPSDVVDTIVRRGKSFFAADSTSFWLYDPESEMLELSSSSGDVADHEAGRRIPADQGLSGQALAAQQAMFVEDYDTWEGRVPDLQNSSFRSLLAVPVIGRFGTLGVLVIRSRQRGAFGKREAGVADLFAAQAAAALENAQLNQEAQRRASEFSMLYEAGIDLLPILDVEQLLDSAAAWARRVFEVPRAVIYLRDPDSGEYMRGRSVEDAAYAFDEADERPSAGGLTETIVRTRESVLIRDNREHPTASSRRLADVGLLSQMGTPLRVGATVLGAIFVNEEEADYFSEEDLNLLEFLANQISSALQNALQFAQTEEALSVVERQARYQTNISQAAALLTERGTEGAISEVLRLLGEASEVAGALYFAFQGEGDYWHLAAHWPADLPAGERAVQRLDVAQITYWAEHLTKQPFLTARARSLPEPEREFLRALEFNVALALTVPGEADYPGFILLGKDDGAQLWQSDEIVALQTAAAALSNTLARERLFQRVQASLDESEMLYQASAALNMARTYEAIMEILREYTIIGDEAANNVSLLLFDRPWQEGQEPEYAEVMANWSDPPREARGIRYDVNEFTAANHVMRETSATIVKDVRQDERLDRRTRALLRMLHAHSLIVAPLVAAGQKIGYIQATYIEAIGLTERNLRQLESLTRQAAIAVQNIRQLETIEARAQRERTIREITERIQQAPDVQGVLQAAVREVSRAFGTSRSRIQFRAPRRYYEEEPSRPEAEAAEDDQEQA